MCDTQVIEVAPPLLDFGAITASECQMVETQPALVEMQHVGRVGKLVQADDSLPFDQPDDTTEGSGRFVNERLGTEQLLVPRNTAAEIAYGQSDMSDSRERGHRDLLVLAGQADRVNSHPKVTDHNDLMIPTPAIRPTGTVRIPGRFIPTQGRVASVLPVTWPPESTLDTAPQLVGKDGSVYAFGGAQYLGSPPGIGVSVHDVVGIVRPPKGGGWLNGSEGDTVPRAGRGQRNPFVLGRLAAGESSFGSDPKDKAMNQFGWIRQ